jgi:hypothetical protein
MLPIRPLGVALNLCAAILTGGALVFVAWGWPADDGIPSLPALLRIMQRERSRGEDLTRRLKGKTHCLLAKFQTARDVIAGRLQLLDAAAKFRELQNAVADYDWTRFREAYSGQSDDERHCRAVIGLVETELQAQPTDSTLLERLEKELQMHLERGTLRLPGAESPPCSP